MTQYHGPACHYSVSKLVSTFPLSTDDVSEERLKELWLSAKKPSQKPSQKPPQDQPEQQDQEQQQELLLNEDQEPGSEPTQAQEDQLVVPEEEALAGFGEEPFVRAAAMYRGGQYHGILELLTRAVEEGERGSGWGVWSGGAVFLCVKVWTWSHRDILLP